MYSYLVTDKKTGKNHLAECSSPSVAIADAAKDAFTAQRVEGAVLDVLKATPGMELRVLKKDAAAAPAGGDPAANAAAGAGAPRTAKNPARTQTSPNDPQRPDTPRPASALERTQRWLTMNQ